MPFTLMRQIVSLLLPAYSLSRGHSFYSWLALNSNNLGLSADLFLLSVRIGPMISGGHPQSQLTPAQLQAQQAAQSQAAERAKMKARKPTDKNIPDGVEDCIIGDGVQRYREMREIERRLDSTMMRKRLDITESVNRNVKRFRTLRVWISNTVEDQPWQADGLDVDTAFDFSTNLDASYRVKIEARLLDEEDDEDSDDSEDEDEETNGDAMDEDGKEKKTKTPQKQYKFSHFFKAMTVEFDRNKGKDGSEQGIEWKKPVVAQNAASLPNAADFDQLEFKRGGDENTNITINLTRDESPERYKLSPILADILDREVATRAEAMMGIWDYIKAMGLDEDEEKRSFDCDDRLKSVSRLFYIMKATNTDHTSSFSTEKKATSPTFLTQFNRTSESSRSSNSPTPSASTGNSTTTPLQLFTTSKS